MGARGVKIHINRFDHPDLFEKLIGIAPLCTKQEMLAEVEIIPDEEDSETAFRRFVASVGSDAICHDEHEEGFIRFTVL
jgi:hypothetical protein